MNDRYCILRDARENKQRVYDYHRRKVTCLAIHPDRQFIASCEEGEPPLIHFWDSELVTTKVIIPTRHQHLITRIVFSRDGELVATLGGY